MQAEGLTEAIGLYRQRFVDNLVWMRKKLELPVKTLADIAGIERKTYYNLTDGTYAPEFRTIVSLAEILGVEPGDMFMEPAVFQLRFRKAKPPRIRVVIDRPATRAASGKVKASKRTLSRRVVHLHEHRRAIH
jgi:DNA-binding XRE family transcriptional regulator